MQALPTDPRTMPAIRIKAQISDPKPCIVTCLRFPKNLQNFASIVPTHTKQWSNSIMDLGTKDGILQNPLKEKEAVHLTLGP